MIGKWVMAPIRATAGRVSLQMTHQIGCHRLLIPLDAYARHLWDVNLPVADFAVPLRGAP